jgi:hypothetical protein
MTDYVSMHVPEIHYGEMLKHLASLMNGAPVATPGLETKATPAQEDRSWSDDVWRKFWPVMADSTRQLLVVIAEHPGEWVPITALVSSLGTFGAVQGALSSLTKRMNKHDGPDYWPLKVEIDTETGRARYQMDQSTSSIVLELARDA